MWMSQHRCFWPGFIESGIVLSNQSPEQGQGYPSRQWRCSHLYGTARRGEQRMRRREEQSCREWGDFSGERDDDRSHSSSCEASRRFSCIRPLVANTWFYFVFKLLWNRLQSYIPAEPQHPGFSFQADAQNSEVLFSYKHVLWLPLCLAIHIPWTRLWEKIICLHQKQLLHHLTRFPFHMEGKSHPKSFQPTKNTSFPLQIHLLCTSTHQRAEKSPHDLGDMLFSAWPTALCLQLDGSLETRGILCCWRAKRRLLEQLTAFLFGTS